MPNIRIKDIPTTASATVNGDFFAVDSSASTRKLNAFSPTFGGNVVVTGTLTVNGTGTNSIPNLSVTGIGGLNVSANFLTSANTLRFSDSAAGGQTWFMSPQLGDGVATNFAFYSNDGVTSTPLFRVSSAGVFRLPSTAASTSTSSGALVVSGGVGIGGSLNAGANNAANSITGGDAGSGTSILQLKDGLGSVKVNFKGNGDVAVQSSTASTSTSSGALVVSGGMGIAKQIVAGGVISIDPLDASPEDLAPEVAFCRGVSLATTASVLAFGSGARIGLLRGYQDGGNLVEWRFGSYIGTTFNEQMRLGGTSATSSSLTLYGTTASTSTSSGALVIGNGTSGGLGVGGSVNINNNLTLGYASAGDSVLKIIRSSGGNEWLQIAGWNGGSLGNNAYSIDAVNGASARPVYFRRSTDAGSTYTNFLTWDTSNNATFAGTLTANTSVSSPQLVISSDSLGLSGGAGFYKKEADTVALGVMTSNTLRAWIRTTDARWFYQSGTPVTIQDTTASTATNIGALVVSGGVGVGNEVSVYGRVRAQLGLHADGNVPAGLASAYQVDLQAGTSRDILSFGDSSRAGLIRGEQDGSGRATLKFGRYTPSTFAEYLRITGVAATDAVLSVYGTTSSTSTSSGALVVSGGVGVAGAIYAGGSLNVASSSTALTSLNSSTSGATGYNQASFTLDSGGTPKTAVLGVQDTGAFVGTNTNHDVTIRTNTTTRVTVSSSDVTIASGVGLKLGNAYVAGAPTATGYIVIKDSTGTSYKIPAVAL